MANCPGCNKFAALEFQEPEIENDVTIDGTLVQAQVRIYRTSECCGEEMKEATLEMEEEIDPKTFAEHIDPETLKPLEGHDLAIENDDPEQVEEGGGRFKKSYFGASVEFRVRCSCQEENADPLYVGTLTDKISASGMDEMV